MPSVHRQENNIVHAIRGCAKSAAPDVLYAARIDVYIMSLAGRRLWPGVARDYGPAGRTRWPYA